MKLSKPIFRVCFIFLLVVIVILNIDDAQSQNITAIFENKFYRITGDRQGQVLVKDINSKKILYTFQMKEAVVRGLFLLNQGSILAASQKDNTVFWSLQTKQKINQFNQRIYSFSHNEEKFFTYDSGKIVMYDYPQMSKLCESVNSFNDGPEEWLFSPNDKFLAIVFATGRPSNDEYYPSSNPRRRSIVYSKLFTTYSCKEVKEFSSLRVLKLGVFSEDSTYYHLDNMLVFNRDKYIKGSWEFNLDDYSLEQKK